MIDPLALGAAIKSLRLARLITQEELADTLDLSVNYLSQLENGRRGITIPRLNELALALDVPRLVHHHDGRDRDRDDLRDRLLKQIRRLIAVAVKVDSSARRSTARAGAR